MTTPDIKYLAPRIYSPNQRGVPSNEAPLQEAARIAARMLAPPCCRRLLVVPELELGGVRPDLWIGCAKEERFERRTKSGIRPCTAPYPLLVAQELRRLKGSASIEELCAAVHLGARGRILRGVAELVDRGLANREQGGVELSADWVAAEVQGVAVEVKVDQWRKALRQVQMWRKFVNGAWMVFPEAYLPAVPRQRPGTRGIGLATVNGSELMVIRQPRLVVGNPFSRTMLEEHLFARWLSEDLGGTTELSRPNHKTSGSDRGFRG